MATVKALSQPDSTPLTRYFKPLETFIILLIHVLAFALAPATFTWPGVAMFVVLSTLTGSLGISAAYHRLLTHHSFEAKPLLKYFLTFWACLALQGGPVFWVAVHRLHHKESDKPLDPHTPRDGFWWSHMIWNFFDHPKLRTPKDFQTYALDVWRDPVMRFYDRFFFGIYVACAALTYWVGNAVGGPKLALSLVVWGFLLRTVYTWHITWLVNSAAHQWGYRSYETGEDSRNLWWLGLIGYGEGWHNNHHKYQRSAKIGQHRWFEFDTTYWFIKLFEALGWAGKVVKPTHENGNQEVIPLSVLPKSPALKPISVP